MRDKSSRRSGRTLLYVRRSDNDGRNDAMVRLGCICTGYICQRIQYQKSRLSEFHGV